MKGGSRGIFLFHFLARKGFCLLHFWHWQSFTISGRDSYRWICFLCSVVRKFGATVYYCKEGWLELFRHLLSLSSHVFVSILHQLAWDIQRHVHFSPDCEVRTFYRSPNPPQHIPAYPKPFRFEYQIKVVDYWDRMYHPTPPHPTRNRSHYLHESIPNGRLQHCLWALLWILGPGFFRILDTGSWTSSPPLPFSPFLSSLR